MSDRQRRLGLARLYLVCGGITDAFLESALRGGVDIVQLRLKDAADAEIVDTARRFADACRRHHALFILNDRPDLVDAARADGVHVGQGDTPVARAREQVGDQRLVGLSTHSVQQIDDAAHQAVDYIGVGPVYETPTKPGRPAVGLELVRYAAERARVPFFAIGGINADNAAVVGRAGAAGIAVVRALTNVRDPEQGARALRCAICAERQTVGAA